MYIFIILINLLIALMFFYFASVNYIGQNFNMRAFTVYLISGVVSLTSVVFWLFHIFG